MSEISSRSDSAATAYRLARAALAGTAATVATSVANAEIVGATGLSQPLPYAAGSAGTTLNIGGMPGVNVSNSSKSFTVGSDPTLYTSHWVYLESSTGLVTGRLSESSKGVLPTVGGNATPSLSRVDLARRDPNSGGGYHPVTGDGSGYYGLSFDDGAGLRYGWVSISVFSGKTQSVPFNAVLTGWGYETSGAPILAGAISTPVPEPASLLMLTAGAIGLGLKRRRDSAARRAQALAN